MQAKPSLPITSREIVPSTNKHRCIIQTGNAPIRFATYPKFNRGISRKTHITLHSDSKPVPITYPCANVHFAHRFIIDSAANERLSTPSMSRENYLCVKQGILQLFKCSIDFIEPHSIPGSTQVSQLLVKLMYLCPNKCVLFNHILYFTFGRNVVVLCYNDTIRPLTLQHFDLIL